MRLFLLFLLALLMRLPALGAYGFSDDEMHKLAAVAAYQQGDVSADAEHPMLLKQMIRVSLAFGSRWNAVAPDAWGLTPEAALRLPNVLAGSVTSVALAALASLLFTPTIGLMAGLLWAIDPNAIAINRLGKEDTLLVCWFVVAMWAYERAKHEGRADLRRAQWYYTLAGGAFGLMLASKYMPHLLGLYALFNVLADRNPGANRPHRPTYYGAMVTTFLAVNWVVLSPETWRFAIRYVQGGELVHHGYAYGGHLYVTDVPVSLAGVPLDYYLTFLCTRVPLFTLAGACLALRPLWRDRQSRGATWLRLLLVLLLVPYSLMAAKFLRYTLPMLALVDVLAAVGWVWLLQAVPHATTQALRRAAPARAGVQVAARLAVACGLVATGVTVARTSPWFSFYENGLSTWLRVGDRRFPEEAYDLRVRDAMGAIAAQAVAGARVVTDVPAVARYYLDAAGRTDLVTESLSMGPVVEVAQERWMVVQPEHVSFENEALVAQVRQAALPWLVSTAAGIPVLEVYRLAPQADPGRLRAQRGWRQVRLAKVPGRPLPPPSPARNN